MKRIHIFLLFLPILWFCDLSAQTIWGKFGIGFNVNTQKLYGDSKSGNFAYGGSPVVIRYNLNPVMFLESDLGYGRLSAEVNGAMLKTNMLNVGTKLGFRAMHESRINPLFYLGFGVFNFKTGNSARYWDGYGAVGVGAELFVSRTLGFNLMGDFRYTSGDSFDGSSREQGNDGFFNISFGMNYYLGGGSKDPFIEKPPYFSELPKEDLVTQAVEPGPDVALLTFQRDELLDSIEKKDELIKLLKAKVQAFEKEAARLENTLYANGAKISTGYHASNGGRDPYFLQYQDGLAFYEVGQFENAITIFKGLVELDAQNPQAGNWWYWLGESYFAAEDYFAAVRAFQTALTRYENQPKQQWISLMLGVSRWKIGDIRQARDDFENLLRQNPDSHMEMLLEEYLAELDLSNNY